MLNQHIRQRLSGIFGKEEIWESSRRSKREGCEKKTWNRIASTASAVAAAANFSPRRRQDTLLRNQMYGTRGRCRQTGERFGKDQGGVRTQHSTED